MQERFPLRRIAMLDDVTHMGFQGSQVVVAEGLEHVVLVDGQLLPAGVELREPLGELGDPLAEGVLGHRALLATDAMGPLSAEDVESEARARLFNARRLGRDATNYLDETDRALLAEAVLTHESEPRKSINASGQALEDFLREVANDHGLAAQAKKANGASQVANVLYTNGVINSHHQKMVEAPATMRNATAHRKDKKTLKPWELTPGGAFAALSMTLTAIRSIHHYVKSRRQTM